MYSQDLPSKEEILKLNSSEKMKLYELNKQSPMINMLLSSAIPTIGHYKVGNWKKGRKIVTRGVIITVSTSLILGLLSGGEKEGAILAGITLIGGLGTTIIRQALDAGNETEKYNKKLHENIFGETPPQMGLNLQPNSQGANLTFAYFFK